MPNSPPDSSFTPRKEFIRDQRTANAFSLLAISGSSFIRLYSFPNVLITSLRRLFDQRSLTSGFREDVPQNLYEFTLEGKPWSSPKSIHSERLLVDILAVIYQHGYSFLSTIDYGRENDDRLAVAFSRPTSSSSPRSASPMPASPLSDSSGTNLSNQQGDRAVKKIPFALSFPSATLLRVIGPPLHSTPAILQAVRGSWPRGVVSEKKIGEASYEFKLKGYKCVSRHPSEIITCLINFLSGFQEDTFANDSLRHILTLLSSLDTHAFTLLTSLSLTNRSRVKDLWIFTGLVPFDQDTSISDSSNISSSNVAMVKAGHSTRPELYGYVGQVPQHKRRPSAPAAGTAYQQNHPYPYTQQPQGSMHVRAATDHTGLAHVVHSIPGGVLRKPAPRAQVPVSVNFDGPEMEPSPDQEHFRAVLPSVVSSDAENMTGVGAVARGGVVTTHTPGILYTAPEQDYMSVGLPPSPGGPMGAAMIPSSPVRRSPARPVSTRSKTPPPLTTLSRPSSPASPRDLSPPSAKPQANQPTFGQMSTPPLLGAGVFAGDVIRDSALSSITSGTDTSQEIPIKWTGGFDPEATSLVGKVGVPEGSKLKHMSIEPQLPGAWSTSPDEEKTEAATTVGIAVDIITEPDADSATGQTRNLTQGRTPESLHDVDARVASPELVSNTDDGMRHSEAGLIGMMGPMPPPQKMEKEPESQSPVKRVGDGTGWVLVNVEGKPRPEGEGAFNDRPTTHLQDTSKTLKAADLATPKGQPATTLSSAVKSIAIIDAKNAKQAKGKGKAKDGVSIARSSGLRRLLSFSKRGEISDDPATGSTVPISGGVGEQHRERKFSRTALRDRLKRKGVPEASSVDDRRLSVT
jgi:hypothetical protein